MAESEAWLALEERDDRLVEKPEEARLYVVRRIRRAFMAICRCGDSVFSPYGVTTDQYFLIRAVQKNEGIRQADLGNEVSADANTITAMVSLLERRGIVRREACPNDGRARRLRMTAKGNRLMELLIEAWEATTGRRLNACFEGEGGRRALEIMDRVHEAMLEGRSEIAAELAGMKRKGKSRVQKAPSSAGKLLTTPRKRRAAKVV